MTVDTDFDTFTTQNSSALQLDFLPNVDYNTAIIITLNATNPSAVSPKTVLLAIHACAETSKLFTKAQVESSNHLHSLSYSLV